MVLRRTRWQVLGTLPLPPGFADVQVLAVGGHMKATICLVKGGQALASHHLGDLTEAKSVGENLWPLDGGAVAGIVLDGTGLGPDGTYWGGEVLLGDYRQF